MNDINYCIFPPTDIHSETLCRGAKYPIFYSRQWQINKYMANQYHRISRSLGCENMALATENSMKLLLGILYKRLWSQSGNLRDDGEHNKHSAASTVKIRIYLPVHKRKSVLSHKPDLIITQQSKEKNQAYKGRFYRIWFQRMLWLFPFSYRTANY